MGPSWKHETGKGWGEGQGQHLYVMCSTPWQKAMVRLGNWRGDAKGMPTWSCVPTEHPILDQGSVLAGRWCLGQFSSAGGRREQRVPVIILSKGEPVCPLREMSPFGSWKESWNVKTFCKTAMPANYPLGGGGRVSFRVAEQTQVIEPGAASPSASRKELCVPLPPWEPTSPVALWVLQCKSNQNRAAVHWVVKPLKREIIRLDFIGGNLFFFLMVSLFIFLSE